MRWILPSTAVILAAIAPRTQAGVDLQGSLEAGFDSFVQRFRITDVIIVDTLEGGYALRDTTDSFTELRGVGQLVARFGGENLQLRLRPRASVGTDMHRQSVDADLRWRSAGRHRRLDLSVNGEARQFRDDSDFSLSSDTEQLLARIHLRQRLGGESEVGIRSRLELLDYEERSVYEYDQRRADVALTLAHQGGWSFTLDGELGGGWREVPDSTEIAYERGFASGTLHWSIDDAWRTDLHVLAERRRFRDETVRSPYWDFVVEPGLSWQVSPQWKLEARSAMEWLQYDESTEIYFDLWVGRVGLLMGRRFGSLEVGVEPRWSWLVSTEPVEDQYEQPSVLFRFDWFRQGRFWLSLTEEIGRRDYVTPLPDGLQLYSDYTFFRTSVLGSVTIDEHLSLDVFVSDEPESHHRSEDDGRLTLLTLSLRWTF